MGFSSLLQRFFKDNTITKAKKSRFQDGFQDIIEFIFKIFAYTGVYNINNNRHNIKSKIFRGIKHSAIIITSYFGKFIIFP